MQESTAPLTPASPGGAVTPILANGLTATVVAVSPNPGTLEAVDVFNPAAAAAAYLQFFDAPPDKVVLGTTKPKWSVGIAQNSARTLTELGLNFRTALSVAATTTATGNTAPGTAVDANIGYQ